MLSSVLYCFRATETFAYGLSSRKILKMVCRALSNNFPQTCHMLGALVGFCVFFCQILIEHSVKSSEDPDQTQHHAYV